MTEFVDSRPEIPRLTDDELTKLAGRIVRNEVFLGIDDQTVTSFKMILALAGGLNYAKVGAVWEEIDKAGPRAVNGMPAFMSIGGMVHIEDCNPLLKKCREMLRATGVDIPSEEEIAQRSRANDAGYNEMNGPPGPTD